MPSDTDSMASVMEGNTEVTYSYNLYPNFTILSTHVQIQTKLSIYLPLKYLGSHVALNGRANVEVSHRVKEASKCMGGMKSVLHNRALGMNAKRLYEGVVVPTVLYGAETWNVWEAERNRLDVFEMRCLRSIVGVTRMDRVRNEEVRRQARIVRKMSERVDQIVLS